jgi:hypothetical protein
MTKKHLIPRRTLFSALLTGSFAVISLTPSSRAGADDCLASPGAAVPAGTHWYYRVDRATQRHCWYLGAEGTRARVQTHQASAPAKPRAKPATPGASIQVTSSDTAQDALPPSAMRDGATGQGTPTQDAGTAALFMGSADALKTPVSLDIASDDLQSSSAQTPPRSEPEDEMPLVWPVLTPAERAATDQPSGSGFAHMAGLFAAFMGAAALIGMVLLRISTRRATRRSGLEHEPSLQADRRARRALSYKTAAQSEYPLAPSAHDATWQTAPDDEAGHTVPEILRQLHWRTHGYELDDAMLAPAH